MILKLYIQKKIFHLPRNQEDLTEMIKENFYKRKPLVKSGFSKLYRIADIESQNVKYEKNANIFLINLYLLVLQFNEELLSDSDIAITLSDENILDELSKKLGVDLKETSIEELENKVNKFISREKESNEQNNEVNKGSDVEGNDPNGEVEFSLAWVKAMNDKIKG